MSTLIEELEQAADEADAGAEAAFAARLRQRAAWVRELSPMEFTSRSDAELWHRLTGPIPAATPCAGCLPAEGDYGDGPPPMVLGRHVEGCNGTALTERDDHGSGAEPAKEAE